MSDKFKLVETSKGIYLADVPNQSSRPIHYKVILDTNSKSCTIEQYKGDVKTGSIRIESIDSIEKLNNEILGHFRWVVGKAMSLFSDRSFDLTLAMRGLQVSAVLAPTQTPEPTVSSPAPTPETVNADPVSIDN
jgi:hypothetical protein